jgi:nicotinamide mononucleotide adenylyltransferase
LSSLTPVGLVHGRFQVVHHDHLRYMLAGKNRCSHLVVGITNPDPVLTRPETTDPSRSDPRANPLTYFERYQLVRAVLVEAGIPREDLSVVPFPINLPDLYRYYVPLDALYLLTIYDEWGERKLERFRGLGLRTEVLWRRPLGEKGLRGTEVRRMMAAGEAWEPLVPPPSARLLKLWGVPERLREMKTG